MGSAADNVVLDAYYSQFQPNLSYFKRAVWLTTLDSSFCACHFDRSAIGAININCSVISTEQPLPAANSFLSFCPFTLFGRSATFSTLPFSLFRLPHQITRLLRLQRFLYNLPTLYPAEDKSCCTQHFWPLASSPFHKSTSRHSPMEYP